jgi:multiple sugar transport system ATP-binding protein
MELVVVDQHATLPQTGIAPRKASMPVALEALQKRFGRNDLAVDIDELTINGGEFVSLLGPSGCGKTTTMRMIAGLEYPTGGDILFDGQSILETAVQKRDVAMVFQDYALYPHMRVRRNLEYGLKRRKVAARERHRRIEDVARLLHIEHLLSRKPRELSGGEQQRVALGRAIVRSPNLLLLDEPLSNLDAKLRVAMRSELVRLHRNVACTTIYVTHDQLEALTMSERIAVMSKGRVQQFDVPERVYDRPANLFVAGFIGNPPMNFFSGRLTEEAGALQVRVAGGEVELPETLAHAIRMRQEDPSVTVGVRPESISLVTEPPGFEAKVGIVELVGAERHVILDSAAGPVTVRVGLDVPVVPGDTFFCRPHSQKVRLFQSTSGNAIGEEDGE